MRRPFFVGRRLDAAAVPQVLCRILLRCTSPINRYAPPRSFFHCCHTTPALLFSSRFLSAPGDLPVRSGSRARALVPLAERKEEVEEGRRRQLIGQQRLLYETRRDRTILLCRRSDWGWRAPRAGAMAAVRRAQGRGPPITRPPEEQKTARLRPRAAPASCARRRHVVSCGSKTAASDFGSVPRRLFLKPSNSSS